MQQSKNWLTVLGASVALNCSMPALAAENVMLVLDASGSMLGQVGGKPKANIARDAVAELLRSWPAGDKLGLVAYGHRRKGDCKDIETLLPVGTVDAAAFGKTVNAIQPKGMTPLSDAVIQAAESLKYKEQKATVILVSDGQETCQRDPCAVGRELEKAGKHFTTHVIGFDVADPRHQEQLKCLARNTGGRYFNARNAGELNGALGEALKAGTSASLPPATASINPPKEVGATTTAAVPWQGPATPGDYITIVKPSAGMHEYLGYDDQLKVGHPAQVLVPAEPGEYEMRYVSPLRDKPVLARAKVLVKPAMATLEAPTQVMASDFLPVKATGPSSSDHWIGIAAKGSAAGSYISFVYPDVSGKTSTNLTAPQKPGEYEVRYVLGGSDKIAARRPLTVTPLVASFNNPPNEVRAGENHLVYPEGPLSSGWIGYVPRGASAERYETFVHLSAEGRHELVAPEKTGNYDLVYVLSGEQGDKVVARHPVRVR